jgi:hypothetical protein
MQAPQLSLTDSYDAMQQGLQTARPDAAMELEETLAEIRPELDQLSDEELGLLIQGVEGLYGDPEGYAKEVADLVKEDLIDEGDFPAEYDEEFLAAFLMVLVDAQRSRMASSGASQTMPVPESSMGMAPMGMTPPQGFARGGIAEAARMVANSGRYGDTMLAHITPSEARLLRERGGSGTINPETGLPEFFLKKLFKAVTKPFVAIAKVVKQTVKNVGNVVKKALSSPVGRILGTIALGMVLGPAVMTMFPALGATVGGVTSLTAMGSAVTGALASGSVAALSGGDLKSVLTSAATGFLGAPGGPVGNFIGKYTAQVGVTNAAANAALTGAIVGTGTGLVSGQNLKDSLKSGLTEGVISGGMAYFSGAPKVDIDNAAATAARDAADTRAYVDELGGVTKPTQGAGSQRAGVDADMPISTSTRPMNKDTALTTQTFRDGRVTEQLVDMKGVPLTDVQTVTPGLTKAPSTAPAYKGVDVPDNIFAQKPGMSPSEYARGQADAATKGILGTPAAREAYGFGPPANNLTSSYSGRDISGMPNPNFDLNANLSGSMAAPPPAPGFYDKNVAPLFKKAGDLYDEYLSPSGREKAAIPNAQKAYSDAYASAMQMPNMTPENAGKMAMKAYDAAMPGPISTYGPLTAAGIGALALTGGFSPKPPPQSEFAGQMRQPIDLSGDPSRYYVQGLPGVQYDERGNITGSFTPPVRQTMDDIRVAGRSYVGFNPMSYQPSRPMFMNTGGIAALAQGGYPRRTGQISGPGTEKSDSIPAMLSDGEFVMTAKAVRGAGGGSRREGAKRMYALMNQLERNAARG